MNGEALTKRYEVRDAETGEVVEGPVHVLRPEHDEWARSTMHVYVRLCGVKDCGLSQALVRPTEEMRLWIPKILEERGLPSGGTSYTRDDLIYRPSAPREEVTLADTDRLAAEMGFALAGVVYQETEEGVKRREESRIKGLPLKVRNLRMRLMGQSWPNRNVTPENAEELLAELAEAEAEYARHFDGEEPIMRAFEKWNENPYGPRASYATGEESRMLAEKVAS